MGSSGEVRPDLIATTLQEGPLASPSLSRFDDGMSNLLPTPRILLGAFCLAIACANASWAQSHTEDLKTFTAPDGAFSFNYSDQLIRCVKDPRGSYVWSPAENCNAHAPVCDDTAHWASAGQTSIACFAYPKNKFTDTPAFEAATFSVEVVDDRKTAKSCLAGPEGVEDVDKHGIAKIDGVSFSVFEIGEGGMNQSTEGDVYRTFHDGKCYQLGINRGTAQADVFDPPVRELSDADWHEVNGTLEQARKSFRFLK